VTKRIVCEFTSVSAAENQEDRMKEITMEGFLHIQNLGNVYKLIWAFRKIKGFPELYA
jgi:hypothetical protein